MLIQKGILKLKNSPYNIFVYYDKDFLIFCVYQSLQQNKQKKLWFQLEVFKMMENN